MLTHDDLIQIGVKWLSKPTSTGKKYYHSVCTVILTELKTANTTGEIPDVLGFTSSKSVLIECKTSLADFNRDLKKPVRTCPALGVGSYRWYLAPAGIIPHGQIPERWGLLEVLEAKKVVCEKEPEEQEQNKDAEIVMLVSYIRRSRK